MLTDRLIALSWAIFCGCWAVSSLTAKASIGAGRWRRWFQPARFFVPAVALGYIALVVRKFPLRDSSFTGTGAVGAALCIFGISIAIWARVCIGDDWGMPMTQRETPHLVTSGPYAYVRHPIYTGVLLGMMGTMLAANPKALVGWLIALAYLCMSAIREERDMLQIFPDQYRAYMSRTKRLIPFVW